ncbi:MAG: methyltransferase domain-containing protein [Hyphomicrobiales bacterium]|nr:methyltransferase domain-containing protein [Hyphomicrobiales bacterium]MDE2018384.1 methyltransferase domain-containing protein [Hyphomicrobiales bacterium]
MAAREHASSGDPRADARHEWGRASLAAGDAPGAADLFAQALDLAPGWAAGWMALGDARERLGDRDGAVAAYAHARACDGADSLGAAAALARLGAGDPAAELPQAYVRRLFDAYATDFDAHLSGALAYRGPELLRAAVEAAAPGRRFGRMMDLGCGTGLAGVAFASMADRIEGADLSPAMLARARGRGLYLALHEADFVAALDRSGEDAFDLVVAADAFVYLGDLAPVLRAAARAMAAGGLIAFTAQAAAQGARPFALGPDQRFAHARAHVEAALADAGLATRSFADGSTRREGGLPVPGWVVVAGRDQ